MRTLLPTFAFVLLAAPAFAGSIEPVATATSAGASIETITCNDCPPLKPRRSLDAYHVDAIEPGTQKVEIREAGGERKIFRTEAWMGGSPVLFVSKEGAMSTEFTDEVLAGCLLTHAGEVRHAPTAEALAAGSPR